MPDTTFGPKGWTPERLGDLSGKTYLITGANAGMGFQAALMLLKRKAKVVMLNRSAKKSEAAVAALRQQVTGAEVSFVQMDLASLASVRGAAEAVLTAGHRIDALICNAAIAQVPNRKLTVDGFESQLGTNHHGHFLLSGLLFEQIKQCRGRIVVVASLGYNMGLKTIKFDDLNWIEGYGPNVAYSQSKLAQMMFAYELQNRLAAGGDGDVQVYVCHPGSSATSLISTSGSRTIRAIWWLMTKPPMVQKAEQGAYPEVMCATEPAMPEARALYGPTGRMEAVGPVGRGTLNSHAHDKAVMTRLWEITEDATGFAGCYRPEVTMRHRPAHFPLWYTTGLRHKGYPTRRWLPPMPHVLTGNCQAWASQRWPGPRRGQRPGALPKAVRV